MIFSASSSNISLNNFDNFISNLELTFYRLTSCIFFNNFLFNSVKSFFITRVRVVVGESSVRLAEKFHNLAAQISVQLRCNNACGCVSAVSYNFYAAAYGSKFVNDIFAVLFDYIVFANYTVPVRSISYIDFFHCKSF